MVIIFMAERIARFNILELNGASNISRSIPAVRVEFFFMAYPLNETRPSHTG